MNPRENQRPTDENNVTKWNENTAGSPGESFTAWLLKDVRSTLSLKLE
jgi:hypothetical protein